MKIAMLSEGRDPLIGGGQLYAKYLCEHLIKDHGCMIDVFTRAFVLDDKVYKKNEHLKNGKRNIFRIGPITKFFALRGRLGRLINVTITLYKKAKKEKYDIIHAHALSPGLPAKIVGKLCQIPVVFTVHGTMQMDADRKGLLYRGEKFFVTKIKYDLEISVSHRILNYPNVNKNIKIIYPGLNIDKFKVINKIRKYPGRQFLFVGRLDWQKGLEYLLEAIKIIGNETLSKYQFMLNIVGSGDLMGKLKRITKEYGIEKFVNFKGKLLDQELVEEYQKNSVFILPSLAEGQPIVVFEAFASRIPVIVTDVGDNKYFVKNNENGYIVQPGNALELVKAILHMFDTTKEDIDKMGHNGFALAKEYDRGKVTHKIYIAYNSLLS